MRLESRQCSRRSTLALAALLLVRSAWGDWQLADNAAAEGCLLQSGRVEIFDGYQQGWVQLRVTADALQLESQAPLDESFGDLELVLEQRDPEAERALAESSERLAALKQATLGLDAADLEQQIAAQQREIEIVTSHKWYQDYKHNPINAERLDGRLRAAREQLDKLQGQAQTLHDYRQAEADLAAAEQSLAELKPAQTIPARALEQRKSVTFELAPEAMGPSLGAASQVRVRLRFWPTWPATAVQQATIDLTGFAAGYTALNACLGRQ